MPKIMNLGKTILLSMTALTIFLSCAKEETTVKALTPNPNPPVDFNAVPPTITPGAVENRVADPICTIPLLFPSSNTASENEAVLGDLIAQPNWVADNARIPAPNGIEPPIMMCLFVDTTGAKPMASIRLEYEDRSNRVQYTLKDHIELDDNKATRENPVPPPKANSAGNQVIYMPSYYVNLDENNFEILFMPTWGFITIRGQKDADELIHAKIHYIKFLNAPIEPYYLSFHTPTNTANTADIAKIQHCTGEDGQSGQAKIVHPTRPGTPPVECARAHRFIRSVFRGPYDATMAVFKSHNEYTGNPYNYRIEMVRQYSDESDAAMADFQTALGQKPKLLGTIKFKAEQVWAGVAP